MSEASQSGQSLARKADSGADGPADTELSRRLKFLEERLTRIDADVAILDRTALDIFTAAKREVADLPKKVHQLTGQNAQLLLRVEETEDKKNRLEQKYEEMAEEKDRLKQQIEDMKEDKNLLEQQMIANLEELTALNSEISTRSKQLKGKVVALEDENKELSKLVREARRDAERAKGAISRLRSSVSWRVTAPLRGLGRLAKR